MGSLLKIRFLLYALHINIFSDAQIKLKGRVYDNHGVFPIEAVSVLTGSGKGAITDSTGYYEIFIMKNDSVWFSYLNKSTQKFAVNDITNFDAFNISLQVSIQVLQEVRVAGSNYRLDSINNRIEYKKVFNYQKPSFHSIVKSISLTGVIIDLDELIRLFQFRKTRNMLTFKHRLLDQEQQKFIERKFNKKVIKQTIDIPDENIPEFILLYTPKYEFVLSATEYAIKYYIKECYEKYKSGKECNPC
jgi:hypothetical protein